MPSSKVRRFILMPLGAVAIATPTVLAIGHHAATAKAPDIPPPLVQTAKPTRGNVPVTSSLSGTLAPFEQAKLYAKTAGYLKAIYVDKGDHVKAGQLLALIDAPELQSQLAAAKSKALQAQANLVERRADYQKALSEERITALAYDRLRGARKQSPDLIAPMEEDLARSKAEQAKAEVATARGQIEAAKADVAAEQAVEQQVAEQLAYTKIVAPFAGIISARFLDPGAMVQTGVSSASQAVPVVEVIDPDRLRLDVHVAETDVPFVKAGTPVTVTLPAVPGAQRNATIKRTSIAEATDTRTMLAEAELDNKDHDWHPGMFAKVTLQLAMHKNVLTLPDEAIQRQGERASVFLVGPSDILKIQPVELSADDGVKAEVTQGIAADDLVAIPGTEPLKEGMTVRHG